MTEWTGQKGRGEEWRQGKGWRGNGGGRFCPLLQEFLRVPMRGVCVRVCVSVHKHSAFCLIVTYIGQNLGRVFKIIGQGRSRTRSFFSDGSRSLSKIMTCFIVGGEIPSPRALFPSVLFCLFVCLSAG